MYHIPQKSGKLTINSGNYDISVVQYDNVNMGMFQVRQPKEAKIKVNSNSASINILPLPSPSRMDLQVQSEHSISTAVLLAIHSAQMIPRRLYIL